MFDRPEPYSVRRKKQPQMRAFPTTQIGSLPQTKELRKARADYTKGNLSYNEYEEYTDK